MNIEFINANFVFYNKFIDDKRKSKHTEIYTIECIKRKTKQNVERTQHTIHC